MDRRRFLQGLLASSAAVAIPIKPLISELGCEFDTNLLRVSMDQRYSQVMAIMNMPSEVLYNGYVGECLGVRFNNIQTITQEVVATRVE